MCRVAASLAKGQRFKEYRMKTMAWNNTCCPPAFDGLEVSCADSDDCCDCWSLGVMFTLWQNGHDT